MSRPDLTPVLEFLSVETPPAWVDEATRQLPILLMDHANCEKKAASTALGMMYRYVDQMPLLHKMSQLAREELRHFEQVLDVMQGQGIEYRQISSARYAQSLHELVRREEPWRLLDTLVLGAVVEARSCERFIALADVLPEPVADLYRALVNSEARHFADYLALANEAAKVHHLATREVEEAVARLLEKDAELVLTPDPQFRFHSGVPD
jgi:tRNA-(ms[2]io[6]A)-hydroxylase